MSLNNVNNKFTHIYTGKQYTVKQNGMVLLGVLVLLMFLIMAVTVFSDLIGSKVELALQSKTKLNAKANVFSKKESILYTLATQRFTAAGISQGIEPSGYLVDGDGFFVNYVVGDELRTDGFEYAHDSITFSIQNRRGLIAINSGEQYWLKQVLEQQGLSRIEVNRMLSSLRDYADANNVSEGAGKESGQGYKTNNYLLQRCSELNDVYYWSDMPEIIDNVLNFCATHRTSVLNLNSVPIRLWAYLWPESLATVTNLRASGKSFLSLQEAVRVEPSLALLDEEYIATIGNTGFIVKVNSKHAETITAVQIGANKAEPIVTLY